MSRTAACSCLLISQSCVGWPRRLPFRYLLFWRSSLGELLTAYRLDMTFLAFCRQRMGEGSLTSLALLTLVWTSILRVHVLYLKCRLITFFSLFAQFRWFLWDNKLACSPEDPEQFTPHPWFVVQALAITTFLFFLLCPFSPFFFTWCFVWPGLSLLQFLGCQAQEFGGVHRTPAASPHH